MYLGTQITHKPSSSCFARFTLQQKALHQCFKRYMTLYGTVGGEDTCSQVND